MKKIIFSPKDYKRVRVSWTDGKKIYHRIMLVHQELFNEQFSMKRPIIMGFCDKFTGAFCVMDTECYEEEKR